ncbi:sperm-egg fusion protein TMEM95 isoform X3 [Peromyscus eremicus]|uniref:sperm-egg fusion protein TMEM95 isoform X3 n=1 Tax=Peromyscus eremicus TaxID=42410 RepID=UPI0027DAF26D|nr:sperm-egg fusion protein TMEM95 isoform X3 [Peromyscus eremicus]
MWVLALAGVFLAVAKACIFCRLPTHALPSRLARLSSQMEMQWKEWASPDFSAFALDEVTMNKITEKTHRVLKVMGEKTKIPQYTREATPLGPSFQLSVLPPAVSQKGGSTILYNCSTCEGKEASCWPRKRCFPGSYDLRDAKILLLSISGIVLLLGALSLQVEYRHLQAKDL